MASSPAADASSAIPLGRRRVASAWLGLPVGVGIIAWSMAWASHVTDVNDNRHFALFWVGVAVALVPLVVLAVHPRTAIRDRVAAIGGVGFLSLCPKAIAFPGRPAYFDEYAHWSQVERLHDEGLAFMPNRQVVVIGDYPAMHLLASGVRHLTGLSTYAASLCLLVVFHALCLWAVYAIATRLTGTPQAGGIAAVWYACGPGFWYFNSQFAYEALGVTLFAWSLTALVYVITTGRDDPDRDRWMALGMAVVATLVATHHLSSYLNVAVIALALAVLVVEVVLRRVRAGAVGEVALYGATAAGLTIWWYVSQAPRTRAYMQPYVTGGLVEVTKLGNTGTAGSGAGGQRELFSGSTIPPIEKTLSFAIPVLCALLFAAAIVRIWVRRRWSPATLVMAATGALFFAVYPMMLSSTGAEGARRSWSFSNVGVAAVIAVAVVAATGIRPTMRRPAWIAGAVGLTMILLVGFVAIGVNENYRFPGQYVYGSDTRSVTAELDGAATWFGDTQGTNQPVVADRSAQLAFSYKADATLAVPSLGNPVWDLLVAEQPLSRDQLRKLNSAEMGFVVVDKHQAIDMPQVGFYLDQNEPLALERTHPLSVGSITKFDHAGWIQRIYSSDSVDIYRVLRSELASYIDEDR